MKVKNYIFLNFVLLIVLIVAIPRIAIAQDTADMETMEEKQNKFQMYVERLTFQRQMFGWEWLFTDRSELKEINYPNQVSFKRYDSHPQYRTCVKNDNDHAIYDSNGNLCRIDYLLRSDRYSDPRYQFTVYDPKSYTFNHDYDFEYEDLSYRFLFSNISDYLKEMIANNSDTLGATNTFIKQDLKKENSLSFLYGDQGYMFTICKKEDVNSNLKEDNLQFSNKELTVWKSFFDELNKTCKYYEFIVDTNIQENQHKDQSFGLDVYVKLLEELIRNNNLQVFAEGMINEPQHNISNVIWSAKRSLQNKMIIDDIKENKYNVLHESSTVIDKVLSRLSWFKVDWYFQTGGDDSNIYSNDTANRIIKQLISDHEGDLDNINEITRIDDLSFEVVFSNKNKNKKYSAVVRYYQKKPYTSSYKILIDGKRWMDSDKYQYKSVDEDIRKYYLNGK